MYCFRYAACCSKNNKHIPRHERHVKPLLILQCFGEKVCPAGPWHLFSRTIFQFQWQKTQVSLCFFLCLQSHSENDVITSGCGKFRVRVSVIGHLGGDYGFDRKGKAAPWVQCLTLWNRWVEETVIYVSRAIWEALKGLFPPRDFCLNFHWGLISNSEFQSQKQCCLL